MAAAFASTLGVASGAERAEKHTARYGLRAPSRSSRTRSRVPTNSGCDRIPVGPERINSFLRQSLWLFVVELNYTNLHESRRFEVKVNAGETRSVSVNLEE